MTEELKPCPFCGHDTPIPTYSMWDSASVVRMHCPQCESDGPPSMPRSTDAEATAEASATWNRRAAPSAPSGEPVSENDFHNIALNTMHKRCHEAADAFWAYWNENGETHKRGYYESTWGSINRALRRVGIRPHVWPQPSDAAADAIKLAAAPAAPGGAQEPQP